CSMYRTGGVEPLFSDTMERQLTTMEAKLVSGPPFPVLAVVGPRGNGHTMLIQRLFHRFGHVIEVDLTRMPEETDPLELAREARLLDAVLLLRTADGVDPVQWSRHLDEL